MFYSIIKNTKKNWRSGLTIALVSIPLSISLAIASQTTPIAGIITAVWAGLIASLFGGSNYNIIGPTGALSGFLASYAIYHGASILPSLAIVTGIFILIAYALKIERYLIFVPGSAVHGFTLGVAIIIILTQLNFMLGISGVPAHNKLIDNVFATISHLHQSSVAAFVIFAIFLAAILILSKVVRSIPAVILVSPIGMMVGWFSQTQYPFELQTIGLKFGSIKGNLLSMPSLSFDWSLFLAGLTVAFIAILETLISARMADGITKTKHSKRKEMVGLGLANIVSGICGGIPATAALARTSLNIKSGATNKLSQTISSIFIALISLIFLPSFSYMPLPVIAAILVFVAIRMIEAEHFLRLYTYDKAHFVIALLVALVTIMEDPIIGVLLGTAVSSLLFIEKMSHGFIEYAEMKEEGDMTAVDQKRNVFVYHISGPFVYINAQAYVSHFEDQLEQVKGRTIVLDLKGVNFIDLDGVDALNEIIDMLKVHGAKVVLIEINPRIKDAIKASIRG